MFLRGLEKISGLDKRYKSISKTIFNGKGDDKKVASINLEEHRFNLNPH